MKKQYVPASSFWMDDWDDDELYTPRVNSKFDANFGKTKDVYKLAAHKRAISNFTSILTGKYIPVEFFTSGGSYTDGKKITISADITEPKEFDVAVGLALHEASHIKLTDFSTLQSLPTYVSSLPDDVQIKAVRLNIDTYSMLKDILNIVEDRRIDNFVFQSSPGYRDYYRTLYDKYFNDKLIDKALQSAEMRDETVESYMFRLMNLHSEHTDLSALKRLREIYRLMDLKNIGRLNTTSDAVQLSLQIMQVIIEAIDDQAQLELNKKVNNQKPGDGEGEGAGVGIRSYQNPEESDESEAGEGEGDETESDGDEGNESEAGEGDGDDSQSSKLDVAEPSDDVSSSAPSSGESDMEADNGKSSLSSRQKELLKKKIESQKKFVRGEVKKKSVTQSERSQIQAIEESESSIELVGTDFDKRGIRTVYVRNMTRSLMESGSFPLVRYSSLSYMKEGKNDDYMQDVVNRGISLGTILGKRLQVRGESRETVFNRQKVGKLDRRMISSLGFGNENVFFSREVDQYKKANLHISIDASGSMGGKKWTNTMTNVVALAKAVDMISNLNIQISFRTTTMVSRDDMPYVVIAYDSRRDKFSKIKSLFQYLQPSGTTPEGLCFEAMMKEFVPSNTDSDSYFMNISDGEPYFGSYAGDTAADHIKKQMSLIQNMGIDVLSYFVSDNAGGWGHEHSRNIFKKSYGKAASFIDVTNMVEVSKTMNQMFLSK